MKEKNAEYKGINKTLKKLKKQVKDLPNSNEVLPAIKTLKVMVHNKETMGIPDKQVTETSEIPVAGENLEVTPQETDISGSIMEHLKSKGMTITSWAQYHHNTTLSELARFIGDNISQLSDILTHIRRDVSRGCSTVTFIVPNTDICKKFVKTLISLQIIKNVKYTEKRLYDSLAEGILTTEHSKKMFILGGWLESYVCNLFYDKISESGTGDIARNVKVMDKMGVESEFDLLVSYNNKLYWVECKSGKNFDTVKYAEMAKNYKFDRDSTFVVTAISTESAYPSADNIIHYYPNITVMSLSFFRYAHNGIFKGV